MHCLWELGRKGCLSNFLVEADVFESLLQARLEIPHLRTRLDRGARERILGLFLGRSFGSKLAERTSGETAVELCH